MAIKHTYDEETARIQEVGINVQRLWRELAPKINIADHKDTARKLNEWTKIVEGAFEKIGFRAAVDVNPIYGDRPPDITILERVNPISEFDHDKQAALVKKSRDRGGI